MSPNDPTPLPRRPDGTYRLDTELSGAWELGWDPQLGSFFAQQVMLDTDGTVLEVGPKIFELTALHGLAQHIGQAIPADVAEQLYRDALAFPLGGQPNGPMLADWASMLYQQLGVVPRWSLPATPLLDLLHAQAADWNGADPRVIGVGLGLDENLANGVVDGSVRELGIPQVAQICEALRCSPFELWSIGDARSVLHAYGPELWPRHIEPIDERLLDLPHPGPRAWGLPTQPGPGAIVTPYRPVGFMTVDGNGHPVDPRYLPVGDERTRRLTVVEQIAAPRPSSLPPDAAPDDASAGAVDPRLATTAFAIRDELEEPFEEGPVRLVRFTWPGRDVWLGWNGETLSWERRPDPRLGYAGPSADVIETNGLTDPARALKPAQVEPGEPPPPPVADNPPIRHGDDVIVTGYQRKALLAVDTDGHVAEIGQDLPANIAEYHVSFVQVTRPSIYPVFGCEPETAGDGVDPFLASVASYRVQDLDRGTGEASGHATIDMVRISTISNGGFDGDNEVWLGRNPEAGTWELWDDPRHYYPGPPTDVLDHGSLPPPERWDDTKERLAIEAHDSHGIPELRLDEDHAVPEPPELWLHEPMEPPTAPELEL